MFELKIISSTSDTQDFWEAAQSAFSKGDYSTAIHAYNKVIDIRALAQEEECPTPPLEDLLQYGEACLTKSNKIFQTMGFAAFQAALRLYPKDSRPPLHLAKIFRDWKAWDKVIDYANQVIHLDPPYKEAYLLLALAQLHHVRFWNFWKTTNLALRTLDELLKIAPDSLIVSALQSLKTGDKSMAIQHLNQALAG